MPPSNSRPKEVQKLLPESVAQRPLPHNFQKSDLQLFNHELERVIPESRLLEFSDVHASADGVLFKGLSILTESFAFPANRELWKRRSLIRFFVENYLLRRTRAARRVALWITDDWSYGYFHWLTDALTRLYVVRERVNQLVLLLPAAYETLDFVQASLKCFGVTEVDYVRQSEVIRCRRLLVPTHTAPSGHYNEEAIRGVRALLLNCHGAAESGGSERIYVSRGRAPKRRILNDDATLAVLEEFGFETIYAEDYSFAQQVEIFSRARYVVSNHGAGLTNMLFAREGGSVLELRHHTDAINNCYFTLAAALGLNYFYQTCQSDAQQDPHTADLVVDLTTLRANLQLLTKP
ncbi:MAG TPA: glycosyltransferase family 61 protein [Pyrinomonadaceae bacterium]|jgi:capsular polysaccharide biosynthesis protein|nr:glycosyltransferase family 61 protein [Pyrinomonadaceae bacterium]